MKTLDEQQQAALAEFIERHGATWKDDLLMHWFKGTDVNSIRKHDGCYLRELRNQFGPKWLAQYPPV